MLEVRRLMDPGLELVYEEREEELNRLDLKVLRPVIAAWFNASER
jgi:hypothetical protein